MNKYEQALEWLNGNKGWIDHVEFPEEHQNVFEELLNKSIPMKPIGEHTNRKCGRCETRLRSGQGSSSRTRDTVCRNCFQVVDWGEDNE